MGLRVWVWLGALWMSSVAMAETETCLRAPFFEEDAPRIAGLVAQMRADVAGFASLEAALEDPDIEICLAHGMVLELGYLQVTPRRIVLSADIEAALRRAVAIHELRHLEQLHRGACPRPGLSMAENARAVMAIEADANAVTLLVAWTRRQEGDDSLWVALATWESTQDIALRFEAAMVAGKGLAGAAAEAFAQWYQSSARVERYYLSSCTAYLDQQDVEHRLPSYDTVATQYFRQLCVLPGGTPYDCQEGAAR